MKTAVIQRIFLVLTLSVTVFGQSSDASLRRVIEADKAARKSAEELPLLPASEHLLRAETYMANRLFPQARAHWKMVIDNYPTDPGIPAALFGTARSYMWERDYQKAVDWFERLTKDHLMTKEGREGLAFKGASYVRMGDNLEAVKAYEMYATMFPDGERIESAHLNIIDALREAGKYDEANQWVEKTVKRFAGKPTEINALHARLRLEIYRANWPAAVLAADELLNESSFAGAMTGADEVRYLKAVALEKSGQKASAAQVYAQIVPNRSSYYAGLVIDGLKGAGVKRTVDVSSRDVTEYPVLYRDILLKEAVARDVDPRFVLAIMKQESTFRQSAKSPAGARGLLQLVFDTALKYNTAAGFNDLHPDDLYDPKTNIAIGCEYIKQLKDEFGGLYEGIAASYNGGEDNALRWLNRSKPREPGIFVAEIGFAETKNYVFRVMNNYRIYRELYTQDLRRK